MTDLSFTDHIVVPVADTEDARTTAEALSPYSFGQVTGSRQVRGRGSQPQSVYPKIDRLDGAITWIDLSFVERKRTPGWAIQVGIRCHLAGMSTRDAGQFLDELGVNRSHVAVHNWVQKADPQPVSTATSEQLAVNEKLIRLH